MEKNNKVFDKKFVDLHGHIYGHPIVEDWYGKFLPLQKYSPEGDLLKTIGGNFLSKHTKYKIHDYYTGINLWVDYRGKDFLIVNWHITPFGVVYALIANRDYVKVLKIED